MKTASINRASPSVGLDLRKWAEVLRWALEKLNAPVVAEIIGPGFAASLGYSLLSGQKLD